MSRLQSTHGPNGLQVLGFPCNQFGHQENSNNQEILNSLKYVRPGGGYEPNFPIFEKCEVNGEKEHPLFTFLKEQLPYPSDDSVSLMVDPKCIIWSPVRRNDISWNFEKFLIGTDGVPYKRYSRRFETINIQADIEKLLNEKSK
ncbi:glutathione peroxidase 1 [Pelobates cultripes]|uniref:Glutathione peroxidase n=1 Tax=Pelobates cultripes TaxID=61616 RepID=A0AAD1WLR1_PELCU|nr:glutathione peroxidase 1 [Pelobates cultripes]